MSNYFSKPHYRQRAELQSGDCTAELDQPSDAGVSGRDASTARTTVDHTLEARPLPAVRELDPDRLYTGKQLARVIGISHRTLERWRSQGRGGPPYVKPDGHTFRRGRVTYHGADVLAWLARGRVERGKGD
ncbi:MAG TPA: helix-turn-helix domain-containing protein [Hyphomicrobiaceae bacterium]|nr:helix-turn-helix domain-containing protein [Hyphomicrobiaceae bacterium]